MFQLTDGEMFQLLANRISTLHTIAPDSIGDIMRYQIVSCSDNGRESVFHCKTFEWMRNVQGTLHGGMCATIVDQTMGFVAYCIKPGDGIAPTVQMEVEYHRPLIPGKNALTFVRVLSAGKTLMHLSAEVFQEDCPDKLCLSATGIYCYKELVATGI